jgi:diguanylate cyclase (GGDEF)-like protein
VLLIDAAERLTLINPAARHLLAIDGDVPLGTPVAQLLPLIPPGPSDQAQLWLGTDSYTLRRISLGEHGTMLVLQPDTGAKMVAQQLRREQKLHQLTMTISGALDIETILRRVAELVVDLIGADAGSIPFYDAERDCITSGWTFNLPPELLVFPQYRRPSIIWELIDTQAAVLINNYQQTPRVMPTLKQYGVTAVMAVPIAGPNREIFGALVLYKLTAGASFSEHDLQLLDVVGRQTGIAIQNARRYAAAVREADRRRVLYAASIDIGAALDLERLYQAIHRAINRLMICDSCAIALSYADRQEIEYVYIVDHQGRWANKRVPVGRGLLGHVVRNDVSLRLSNSDPEIEAIFGAERLHSDADETRAILATVMHTGDQIIGAITVQAHAPHAYTSDDLDALEVLAATAAIAVQNALLFARIQAMATIDPLTQVPNRRRFFDLATQEIERSERYKHSVSLLMFDVDSFKAVNDTYGHLAGDQVRREVAARCRQDLRDIDTVARYGGEEFVILLPETSYAQAMQVAHRLQHRICATPVASDVGPISTSVSMGVESFDDQQRGSLENLLDRADRALYIAKNAGRNRVVGYRSLEPARAGRDQPRAELKNETSR